MDSIACAALSTAFAMKRRNGGPSPA
jgi:hypothetical protein